MAKRNQVTTDLRISADAQLKNSRSFINQLDKLIDKFDFGDKINNQLSGAKSQLKEYNKILEKVQSKTLISDDELKDLVKAGKEIANIVTKTEKLYNNMSSNELQKFSKEYIKQVKAQEAAIAKIKNEYTNKTGKNFDKELANYDKVKAKIKELQKERDTLMKSGTTSIATKEVEQLNIKLEEQKKKLAEIKKLQQQSSSAYTSTLENESKKRGYNSYNELKNTKVLNETQIRKQLGNAEYKQQANLISTINRQIKELENSKEDVNQLDKEAIKIAKQHKIQNVSNLQTLKEQLKIKRDILNKYKTDKSALANEKLVTAELEKQKRLAEDKTDVSNIAKQAELAVIQKGGYNTKASLTATGSAVNKSVNTLTGQLTESGIETITNNAANMVAQKLEKINGELTKLISDTNSIDETNKKLATQSERAADEQDIISMKNQIGNTLDETETDVNGHTTVDNDRIANNIIKLGVSGQIPYGDEVKKIAAAWSDPDDDNSEQLSLNLEEYDRLSSKLESEINEIKIGSGSVENVKQAAKEFEEVYDSIIEITATNFEKAQQTLDKALQSGKMTQANYQEELEMFTNVKSRFSRYIAVGANRLDTLDKALNPKLKIDSQVYDTATEKATKTSHAIRKAAEQSQYLGSTFDDIKNKVGYFLSLNYVFDQMTRKITEAVNTTKEMDKDMTQIGLVLGKTSNQVWKNFDTYAKMADRLNTTTSQVTNSMKLFYQQGLNTSEVNKMVEASAIAAALGESTMAEASETLTSIINSYNLSANEAMQVTDKISQIAIVSAADFGELSTAIEKVASSAASAGLDLDHMMGYLGKMIETTREAPTNIGTALKTIVANFTQFKEDPTGLNEEGTEINKVDKALKSVGISLTNANGEVRDLGDVLDELGKIWDTLNRSQKAYLATQIAGTRQQSRFYALMNDYERTLELVAEGSNSAGKAQEQFGLYTDSLEASTSRLTNQWEKFFNSITAGNGVIKVATDGLTLLMQIVNKIGPIGAVLGLGSFIIQLRKGVNEIANFSDSINQISESPKALQYFQNASKRISQIKSNNNLNADDKTKQITNIQQNANRYAGKNNLPNILSQTDNISRIVEYQKQIEKINTQISVQDSLLGKIKLQGSKAFTNLKLGATKAKVAVGTLGKAISTAMMQTVVIFAVTKIFEGITKAIDAATTSAEEYKEQMSQHQSNADTIDGLKDEYETLSKKINKTAEEEKRLKEITEEVTEVDERLGKQLAKNASMYQSNIKAMEKYIEQQEKLAATNAAQAIRSDNSLWDAFWDSSIIGEGFWADTKAMFGDNSQQKTLKTQRFNSWRSLGSARGAEAGLDDELQEMLDLYVENIIDTNQYFDAETIKTKTGQIDDLITNFITQLEDMTEEEKKVYNDLKEFEVDNENSYRDYYNKLNSSNLPDRVKNQLLADVQSNSFDIYTNLDENNYITDALETYENLVTRLSKDNLSKLFNTDLSTLDEQEKKNYEADFAKLTSLENVDKFTSALELGGVAFENYINSMRDSGEITDSTAEALLGLKSSAETLEDALEGLETVTGIIESGLKEGSISQIGILERLASGKLKVGNIQILSSEVSADPGSKALNYQHSFMAVDTKSMVAEAMAGIERTLSPLKTQATSLRKQYENHQEAPKKELERVVQEQIAAQNKVSDIQNNLNQANADLDNARGRYAIREAAYGGILTAPVGWGMDLVNWIGGKDVVGDFENAQASIENFEGQLSEANEELEAAKTATENAAQAYKNLTDETTEVGKAFKEEEQYLKEQADEADKTYDAMKKLMTLDIQPMADFSAVFDQFQIMGQVNQELSSLQQAWDMVEGGAQNYRDVAAMIAADPSLINAIDMESEHLQFSDEALEAHAKNVLQTEMKSVDAKIKGTEAILALLQGQAEGSDAWKNATNEDIASAMAYNNEMFSDKQTTVEAEGKELSQSSENYAEWGNSIQRAYQAVEEARSKYIRGLNSESETNYLSSITDLRGVNLSGSGSDKPIVDKTNIEATKKQILGDAAGNDSKTQELIGKYQDQLEFLKKIKNDLQSDIDNVGGLFKRNSSGGGGGGSDDSFDQVIEKLEKFYNYLRELEELEAEINRIREKRNLIDASKNYYIDDLEKENNLLREQQSIYNDYIRDQGLYLAELRSQIQSEFGDWAYFNKDGVIQVRQTEFTANSEEEEEHLNNFLELVDLYQNEYNTREENINKLYEIENTQLENIKTMYEKILTRVTDVNEAIQRQIDLLDHDITMSFSNIAKFDVMDDKMAEAVEGIKNSYSYINDFEKQVSELNKQVKNGPFAELLLWDEALEIWRVNEEKLNDPAIITKYEKLGYNWQDIDTYVRSVAVKSQSISDSMKETVDSAHEFAETLKGLIDDRISAIQDYYSASTDELNKIFDTFDRKMTDVDNQNNLFGVASASLEDKYLTLVTATAVLKQTIEKLKENKAGILAEIQKEYPEYINMINGVAVVNKQAIEESTNLTDKQKAELLQLYGVLEASEEQVKDLEDKLVDYFNTMLEMEQAKRDAIIELKQSVHDELMARDQEEIDNLRSKYDKMSQLDQEYYSELSQRVNDSRNLRENRQQASDIAQMQARLAILKADNSGTYNAELIDLQRQISEQLQVQADNDIDRELERIQREQQQREEDRQLTISAMENVLTFKDDNNWYWQEAQRIWDEGPESVTGFLRSSNEYSNISMEQRALQFEQLTNSMNTAFTTLQTAQGITSAISDGIVSDRSYEEQAKLDNVNSNLSFIQSQINGGEGSLANKIDWSNAKNIEKLDQAILNATNNTGTITTKMQTLYTQNIGPGIKNVKDAITSYLGANSAIWLKINDTKTSLDSTKGDMNSGFDKTVTAAATAATTITNKITEATNKYIDSDTRLYNWLNDKYAKENAPVTPSNGNGNTAATKPPTKNGSGNSSASNGGNGSGSNTANTRPDLKVGARISVKPGTRWYYDSYGTSPSGTARGGIIKYTNLKGSHPYNIEGLGWIRRQDIVGYSKGGYVDYTGIANVHGTQTEPEAFLNAKQTRLFEGLRDSLVRGANKTYSKEDKEITKEEYNIDNISIEVKQIADVDAIDKVTKRVKEEIYKDAMSNKNNMAVRRR